MFCAVDDVLFSSCRSSEQKENSLQFNPSEFEAMDAFIADWRALSLVCGDELEKALDCARGLLIALNAGLCSLLSAPPGLNDILSEQKDRNTKTCTKQRFQTRTR